MTVQPIEDLEILDQLDFNLPCESPSHNDPKFGYAHAGDAYALVKLHGSCGCVYVKFYCQPFTELVTKDGETLICGQCRQYMTPNAYIIELVHP